MHFFNVKALLEKAKVAHKVYFIAMRPNIEETDEIIFSFVNKDTHLDNFIAMECSETVEIKVKINNFD